MSDDHVNDVVHTGPSRTNAHREEMQYQYEELKTTHPDFIRLVVILPGVGTEPIRCRIKAVQLQQVTTYAAVSYTWATEDGDATKSQRIYMYPSGGLKNRTFLDVTVNCEHALQQIRHSRADRIVWIDSICIDQDNVEERNAQVSKMDFIFKMAKRVDICMNAPNKDFQGAMTTLQHPYQLEGEESGAQESVELYGPYVIRLENLAELFTLRYFKRVWVIQEVVLARGVVLHVNNLIAPVQIETLRQIQAACHLQSVLAVQLSHWIRVLQSDASPDMFSIMNMTMKSLATDPRDRVFAIIGLLPTHIRSAIPIDYTLDLEHVLAYAINACIRDCGDLNILRHARLRDSTDVAGASTLHITDFEHFLARTKTGTTDEGHTVYAVMQPHVLIPRNQVLPRLKVLARYLDICVQPTRQSLNDFKSALPTRSTSLPGTEWLWLIDTIRQRYMPGTPDGAILSAIENEAEHAYDRPALFEYQRAFRGKNSVGFSSARCVAGDAIFEIFGAPYPFMLREVGPDTYRIVEKCYLWADVDVGYWHSSQFSHLSYKRPDPLFYRPRIRQIIEVY